LEFPALNPSEPALVLEFLFDVLPLHLDSIGPVKVDEVPALRLDLGRHALVVLH
jgi:hypothetical protein